MSLGGANWGTNAPPSFFPCATTIELTAPREAGPFLCRKRARPADVLCLERPNATEEEEVMKPLRLSMLALALMAGSAQAQDTMEDRISAAKKYEHTVAPFNDYIAEIIQHMASRAPEDRREQVIQFLSKINMQQLREPYINTIAKTFTVHELDAIIHFHSSPVGKSALKKIRQFEQEFAPMIQQEIKRTMETKQ